MSHTENWIDRGELRIGNIELSPIWPITAQHWVRWGAVDQWEQGSAVEWGRDMFTVKIPPMSILHISGRGKNIFYIIAFSSENWKKKTTETDFLLRCVLHGIIIVVFFNICVHVCMDTTYIYYFREAFWYLECQTFCKCLLWSSLLVEEETGGRWRTDIFRPDVASLYDQSDEAVRVSLCLNSINYVCYILERE